MSRKMKDSGIEWIGAIPEEWKISKLKFETKCNQNVLSENTSGSYEIQYIDIGSVTYEKGISHLQNFVFESAPSRARRIVKEGDTIISTVRTYLKAIAYIDERYDGTICSTGFAVLQPQKNYYRKFLFYSLSAPWFVAMIERESVGISYPAITSSKLINESVILPNYNEQVIIANYLDNRCIIIDQTIKKQKQVIEKLKEYKQSVINEVVTKGLESNVPMKDSGIEWIGKIPEHWSLKPFKYVLNERNEKNNPIQSDERLSLSIDKGVTLYAEKTTNLDRYKDDVSQYKLAHIGDFVLNSMNMIVGSVGISNYFGCVSPAYYTYYDNDLNHVTAKFCDYLFRSKTIKKVLFSLGKGIMAIDRGDDKINTCRLKVSRDDLRSLKLPLPDTIEQETIIRFLDKKCSEIDASIAVKETVVEKLELYKQSLIYECVTGKREVTNV